MTTTMTLPTHWKILRILGWSAAAFILLAPLVAMQFTTEVNWTGADFAFMSGLIAVCGAAEELLLRLVKNETGRVVGTGFILGVFVLVWAQGAVGVF